MLCIEHGCRISFDWCLATSEGVGWKIIISNPEMFSETEYQSIKDHGEEKNPNFVQKPYLSILGEPEVSEEPKENESPKDHDMVM